VTNQDKKEAYAGVIRRIQLLLEDDTDWVAAMATVVCELHHSFEYYHWTGFYRTVRPRMLQIGPYQGGHGCIDISFDNGVCGTAARTGVTQLVTDVSQFPGHIDCSPTTQSEIVVPLMSASGETMAVLDVDSDLPAAFDNMDQAFLEEICTNLTRRYGNLLVAHGPD